MKRIFLALLLILTSTSLFADTHTAATCSYADVSAAITAASSGDTVSVPGGTATWSSTLNITKGIYLIGAGVGSTVITGGVGSSAWLIVYQPTPALNESFRLSGFELNLNSNCNGIILINETTSAMNKIRIDHNKIYAPNSLLMKVSGPIYGVADNNTMYGGDQAIISGSLDANAWTYLTFNFGSADNFYYEDNTFAPLTGSLVAGNSGGKYCFRHNSITGMNAIWPFFDVHGSMGVGNFLAHMGAEIYDNAIIQADATCCLFDARGGKNLCYNNTLTTVNATVGLRVWSEYNNDLNPPAYNIISGQPQYVSDTYFWNNRHGVSAIPATVNITYTYSDERGLTPRENVHFWNENASFNGSTGIGVGLLSARPASGLTVGVGYWATDTNTLYRATGATTWETYYTPYTYPHPLRGEAGSNVPAKVGAGTTITIGPGAKVIIK